MPPTEAAVMVAAPLAVLLAGALLLLLLLRRRRRRRSRRPHHDHAATSAASQHSGYSTTGALAAVAVYVARLLLARAVHALLAAAQLLVAHAAMWLLRCSSTVTGDAAKLPSAGSDGAGTLSGCGGLRPVQPADGAPAPPATQQQQQQQQQQQTPAAAWCSSTGTSSSSALRQPTSNCLLVPAPAAPAVGQTGTSSSRLAHCSTPNRSRSHGLQLGAAAAPAWADATAYVAVADRTAASVVAHLQPDSNSRSSTGLVSALLEPAASGEVDASWQQPAGVTPDVTTQPGSSSSGAAVASSRCVRFGPLPPSKDVWLQQLREMPPQRKQRFLDKLRHTQRRVWLLWRQRSGALRCQQQQAQEQQEGADGGLPGSERPALSWPQQRLWLARGAAAGSGKPACKRERPPGNTSHSSDSSDDGDLDQDVPSSPVKKQQLLWCSGTSGSGSVVAPAYCYAVPA